MNNQNDELRRMFEKFADAEEAGAAAEDIREGEQILRDRPAPEPDGRLIADIKAEISQTVVRRKENAFRWAVYKTAAVAAVFIVLAVISVKSFKKDRGQPKSVVYASIIPTAIWESSDISTDDADLASLIAEIEQIEGETQALQLGENGGNGSGVITELETELIEIDNSDFWKG